MSSPSRLQSLQRDGFILIPSLLTLAQITDLRTASIAVTSQARSGNWPHVRTLPKQFPPWTIPNDAINPTGEGIWGVQSLMHPSLPRSHTFIAHYFSDCILDIVKELLECGDNDLVMELFNLLVRPDQDFELCWHRDDIPPTASAKEELQRLNEPAWHAQWNLALWDDDSLLVIPGSHARARSQIERDAGPFEKDLPGEIRVQMKAGDVVFYDNNILHRGVYSCGKERMTLHGSVGHVKGGRARARNVLQHGVGEWVGRIDLGVLEKRESERAEGMKRRLVEMAEGSGDVGFSLDG